MKFQDIPTEILSIRVKPAAKVAGALCAQPVFSVVASPTRAGEFEACLKDAHVFVKPVLNADIQRLNAELAMGHAMLAQLANPASDESIELQIAFFTGECLDMGTVEIGVDDYVERAVTKIERSKSPLRGEQLYNQLDELACFHQGDSTFIFLMGGPAIDHVLKENAQTQDEVPDNTIGDISAPENTDVPETDSDAAAMFSEVAYLLKPEPTSKNSFCVTGDGIRFIATETPLTHGESIFIASRLTKNRTDNDRALRLAKGKISFVDWTRAGKIQILAKAQMSALTSDNGSYLKKWDEFGDLEGELLLKLSRDFGALYYSDMLQKRDGSVSVRIFQASDAAWRVLKAGNLPEVEVIEALPDYLSNESLTFKAFVDGIEKEIEAAELLGEQAQQRKRSPVKISDFDAASKTITLATENLPQQSGMLILSLAGEMAQVKRRMAARRAILEGRAANPQLGLLIEEKGQITLPRPPQKVPALTAFVRDKVFRNPPTLMQERAIEVALNTPDIALIQGPPGTGKTTVIAAILERLNEMSDKSGERIKGQVLLTGFQHDAVENMIDRLSLNGIPVPKFGRRSGTNEDDFSAFERAMEQWCSTLAVRLRARNPQISDIEQARNIKTLCLQYIQMPTSTLAGELARQIASLGVSTLGEDLARQAANLVKRLAKEERLNDGANQWLDMVRRLRTSVESFADDGADRAADALQDLAGVLDAHESALLDKASLWRSEDGVPSFLNELEILKKALLVRFSVRPVFRVEKQNDEVIALAKEAITCIKAGHSAKDAKSAALVEFLAELESNPYGMISAVSEYSFAFAATCQQSVNRGMQKQKGIQSGDAGQKMEYDYVIVDEAARVSPRDLMVPMAQGKRIILVGDHRQLPHIIDDEVARQMELGETDLQESDWLKKSMFHYLFSERLKTLEDSDGIPRRVTLDRQYRMHPLLGDFISRNFYERFDSLEKFGSGKLESNFIHNLPGTDAKPVVWLDVPESKGKHQRRGTSWIRQAEATVIVKQLKAWMNSEAGKELSFGVISFYKSQADLISEAMGTSAYNDKNLRIGTVDSFQGMEFDVVFLSMVRTLPPKWTARSSIREKQAKELFGHLCLYNRLNVSMSRQKKLLVVVGDSGLLTSDLATEFIPGLVDFLKLCQTEGTVRSWH